MVKLQYEISAQYGGVLRWRNYGVYYENYGGETTVYATKTTVRECGDGAETVQRTNHTVEKLYCIEAWRLGTRLP